VTLGLERSTAKLRLGIFVQRIEALILALIDVFINPIGPDTLVELTGPKLWAKV
jgi:hypothetical protein